MEELGVCIRNPIQPGEENEVIVFSFDQKLPELKQLGNSLNEICQHVVKGKFGVYPIQTSGVMHKTAKTLNDLFQQTSGLAYLADHLSVCLSLPNPEPRPDEAVLDACLFVEDMPPTVFTLVKDNIVSFNKARSYNLTLVQGVIYSIRRLTTESFSAVCGIIHERDTETPQLLQKCLISLHEQSSKLYVPWSLQMEKEKCTNVIRAFVSSVALTSSVVNEDNSDTLWFLTLEQFRVLTENIDKQEVTVRTAPRSGGKMLMREVAKRLEGSGPTLLIMDSERELQIARQQNTCSFIISLKEWRDNIFDKENVNSITNMVTNCHNITLPKVKGKVWTFLLGVPSTGLPDSTLSEVRKEHSDEGKKESPPVPGITPFLSQEQLLEKVKQLTCDLEDRDVKIRELRSELQQSQKEALTLESQSLSDVSEDAGYWSRTSSTTRSRSSSVFSEESYGATARKSSQKGVLKRIRNRLPFLRTSKTKGYCTECSKVRETEYHERNKLILHTSARLVFGPSKSEKKKSEWKETGKEWKKERDGFVRQLKQRVSALRNSRGGILFVHINDLNPADRCLDLFHELVDNRLNDMIEDGSLFVTIYKKDWLSEEDEENNGFVAITVSPSQSIVTLDYKTKIPLDNSIEDPTSSTILKILSHGLKLKKRDAKIRGLEYKKLRENRHVQVKALFYNNRNTADINSFVKYLWEVLRLREYITSFSKVDGGGSIYIGIQEEEKHYDTYTTRQLVQTGFQVKFGESEIIEALKAKVKDETIVLIKDTDKVRFSNAENLVDAVFHPLPHARGFHVLEVAVAAVAGLVFFDSDGPEAYEIDEISSDKIKRIPCADWYKRLVSPLKKRSIGIQVSGRN